MSRGRIHPDDIAAVRSKTNIEEVIAERVTLRRTGANLTGLCPFHDDSSPSFSVNPERGLWTCFGCGLGGDVISFVQEAEGLPFVEAVQKLADLSGIQLRQVDNDPNYVAPPPGQRTKLLRVNDTAQAFFRSHMGDPDNQVGRDYLTGRNFDEASWEQFGVGYAPNARDALLTHLKTSGFTAEDAVLAGVAVKNEDGRVYDRFRGRLVWPISDLSGGIVGFGARRLREDDQGPKWLNTPDTPLYRKSEVLYGVDRARKDIAASRQVVVVEGYGDVMAAHLAGVTTAVATCGTAFGDGHIKIVRRLMRDNDAYSGKVIFTFDGDAAGQKAALRAFRDNAKFTAQTYVAVAPDNMDPCDLRLHRGDEAVRDLVSGAVPLVEFVIKTTLGDFDLASTEGRVNALRATAPLAAGIRDTAMRTEYVRRLSGWLALPDHSVRSAVQAAARTTSSYDNDMPTEPDEDDETRTARSWRPDPADPALMLEREAAKCLIQSPELTEEWLPRLTGENFTSKAYRGVYSLSVAAGHVSDPSERVHAIREQAGGDEQVAAFINELGIEPLKAGPDKEADYIVETFTRLLDKTIEREIVVARSGLADASDADRDTLLAKILELETQRRELKKKKA